MRNRLLLAAIFCLTAHAAFAQAAYIRPLSPPPAKPAHGFFISSITLVPKEADTDNGEFTATVEVRMQDLPNFQPNSQSMKFTLEHIKGDGSIQDLRNKAKAAAIAHVDEVLKTFRKYKDDFAKGGK